MRVVGRYVLHTRLASGGMGSVYLGRLLGDEGFSRVVAIKVLHPQLAAERDVVEMFLDEARLASRIKHSNVVPPLEVVQAGGEFLLVMEYVHGETLARLKKLLGDERMPVDYAVSIVAGVLHGLHAAHEATDQRGEPMNIVHRDVSPQNVLVGVDGIARVVDFGVAKARGRMHTTQDGRLKGKLAYMAPEQLRGEKVDRRVDIFAASTVLWELLTGERLFAGGNEGETVTRVLRCSVLPPSTIVGRVPKALDAIVLKGLSADPAKRFQTAREMAKALEEAVAPALASDIGEWVEGIAAEALARRAAIRKTIETDSFKEADTVPGTMPSLESLGDEEDSSTDVDLLVPPPPSKKEDTDLIDTLPAAKPSLSSLSSGEASAVLAAKQTLPLRGASGRPSAPPPPRASSMTRSESATPGPASSSRRELDRAGAKRALLLAAAFLIPAVVTYRFTRRESPPAPASGPPAASVPVAQSAAPVFTASPAASWSGAASAVPSAVVSAPAAEAHAASSAAASVSTMEARAPLPSKPAGRADTERARQLILEGNLPEARALLEPKVVRALDARGGRLAPIHLQGSAARPGMPRGDQAAEHAAAGPERERHAAPLVGARRERESPPRML